MVPTRGFSEVSNPMDHSRRSQQRDLQGPLPAVASRVPIQTVPRRYSQMGSYAGVTSNGFASSGSPQEGPSCMSS